MLCCDSNSSMPINFFWISLLSHSNAGSVAVVATQLSCNVLRECFLDFTDLVLPHFLQLVNWELLLLQTVENDVAQAGELAERVGEAPQPLVYHLAEGEEPIRHRRPPLPQGDLEQSPDDPGRVLRGEWPQRKEAESSSSFLAHGFALLALEGGMMKWASSPPKCQTVCRRLVDLKQMNLESKRIFLTCATYDRSEMREKLSTSPRLM